MTQNEDYRLYLDERFKGMGSLINAHFHDLSSEITVIKEQTLKTNSRVNHIEDDIKELEKADIKHVVDCPVLPKVQKIEDDLMEYKLFKKYPKAGITVLVIAVILVLINVLGLITTPKAAAQTKIELSDQKAIINKLNSIILTVDSLKRK